MPNIINHYLEVGMTEDFLKWDDEEEIEDDESEDEDGEEEEE